MTIPGIPTFNRSAWLIVSGVIAAVCGVAALTAWMIWDAHRVAEIHAIQTSDNLAAALANDIDRNVEIFDLSLLTVVDGLKTPNIDKMAPQIRNRILFDGAASARDFGAIMVVDDKGNVRFDSRSVQPRQANSSNRDYFQIHRDQRDIGLYVSAPHTSQFNSEVEAVTFSRRIDRPDGSFGGVVFGALKLDYFRRLFSDVQLGPGSRVSLYRTDGAIVTRVPFDPRDVGRSIKDSVIYDQFSRAPSGDYVATPRYDGIERLIVYQRVGQLPLVVSVAASTATIFAEWRQKAIFTGVAAASLLSLAIILAIAFLRQLRRADRSDARLIEAIEGISEGFVIYDEKDRLVMCNDAYRTLYPANAHLMKPGARFEDIMRAGLIARQTPDAVGREEEVAAQIMRAHLNPSGAHEHRLRDGRWVLTSERRMPGGGIAGLRIDITALKSIQASLRDSQALLNQAQRVSNTGSVIREFATNKVEWSDEMFRIFGVMRETFIPGKKTFFDRIHPDDRARLLREQEEIPLGQKLAPDQFRIVRPDGTVRWIYREAEIIVDATGNPIARLSTYRDITEQYTAEQRQAELENQLWHSQKLEALGNLAGGIAHDLNNTLVPILALSKTALKRLTPDSPERRELETIAAAGEQARDLVKQILAFSRKENVLKQSVDLPLLVRDVLQILRASLPSTIEIAEHIDPVAPVLADSGQIKQVVMNLVTNAAQAIGDKFGAITVSVSPMPAGQTEPQGKDGLVRLSIADTGCGIDPANLDRIFEPFFTTKDVGQGTGLGLAVVHGIVTGHGGRIECSSKRGEGTEFIVFLPATAREDTAHIMQPAA
jgi:PAS domain S-box-containing protein